MNVISFYNNCLLIVVVFVMYSHTLQAQCVGNVIKEMESLYYNDNFRITLPGDYLFSCIPSRKLNKIKISGKSTLLFTTKTIITPYIHSVGLLYETNDDFESFLINHLKKNVKEIKLAESLVGLPTYTLEETKKSFTLITYIIEIKKGVIFQISFFEYFNQKKLMKAEAKDIVKTIVTN